MTEASKPEGRSQKSEVFGYPTSRGVDLYAAEFGMNRKGLLNWLRFKNLVLDISSGGGLLEKEIEILKAKGEFASDVEIIPLDAIYGTHQGKLTADYFTHMAFTNLDVRTTRESLNKVNSQFSRRAVGSSFTALPFADNTFDGIIASHSFGVHAQDKKALMKAYGELARVLKEGSEAFVSVGFDKDKDLLRTTLVIEGPIYYSQSELPSSLHATRAKAYIVDKATGESEDHDYLILRKQEDY